MWDWRDHGGLGVQVPQPWNSVYGRCHIDTLQYVGELLDEALGRPKKATA